MSDPVRAVRELRDRLLAAGYTVDGVLDLLGPSAYAALARGEVVPAMRATVGGGLLATLTRLFVLQAPVEAGAAARALGALEALGAAGLVRPDPDGTVSAAVDIRPYAADDVDLFVVSDLGTGIGGVHGPVTPDHVLGVGGASATLAQLTVRPRVGRALDLGTGCGVQALHLAQHAAHVVATDTNPRAVRLAGLSALLSAVDVDLREGSLFQPVDDETFDLVVTNPPFVVAPQPRYTYRDSPFEGDELGRALVAGAADHLAPGGVFQALLGWLHVRGQDWRERVAGWVVPTGCDAWVVQREVLDPAEYAELWLRDSGDDGSPQYADRYAQWLDMLEALDVEAVGFGWVTLRACGSTRPDVRLEEVRHHVEQPLGPYVERRMLAVDALRVLDGGHLLGVALSATPGLRVEQSIEVGGPGASLPPTVLRQTRGLCRTALLDPVGAEVVTRCDGKTTLGAVVAEVAAGLDTASADGLREGALDAVRTLVEEGFLDLPLVRPEPER